MRQFAAAISGYGLIIGRSRGIAGSAPFLFSFSLILSCIQEYFAPSEQNPSFRAHRDPRRDMAAFDLPCSSPFVLAVTLFVATLTSSINAAIAGTSLEPSIPDSLGFLTEPLSSTVEPPNATGDKKALVVSALLRTAQLRTMRRTFSV